jgi:lipopolysaccharide transport system ATP-binding protein
MSGREWQVGVCGTFDVANYGDLLFPLIAESELTTRLGAVTLHRFSYGDKTPPDWPYEVTSVADLPTMIRRLDGLLIGGGFLIRFDKWVVPGYAPPAPDHIHHPTGYWLTPALLALQHDVPLVWNAPGMNCNEIPGWADPLMERVLTLSRYVSVRDEPSAASLERLRGDAVRVVPDTAFGISHLLNLEGQPSAEFTRLRQAAGLDGPYIVVQAAWGMEGFVRFVKRHALRLRGFRFLALPVGPVLGDDAALIDADLPGLARLPEWPRPLVLAELIARSEAVVGHSYHLFITALASGVPVFASPWMTSGSFAPLWQGRFAALRHFETIFPLPADGEPGQDWFLSRVGRHAPSVTARAACAPLSEHWDCIAAALRMDAPNTSIALNRFWQSLPTLLEDAQLRHEAAVVALETERSDTHARLQETAAQLIAARNEGAGIQGRLDEALQGLAAARAETDARDRRVAEIVASTSWRLTAPVRFLGHRLRRRNREGM